MKRAPNKELNHDNWNDEDVPEERGKFVVADEDVISKRKFLTVKRKSTANQGGVFKAFTGFVTNSETKFNIEPSSTKEFNNSTETLNRDKHLSNVKHLNKTFLEKINQCISENDCCILLPLVDDYKKHMAEINNKYPLSNIDKSVVASISDKNTLSTDISTNSAGFFNTSSNKSIFEVNKPLLNPGSNLFGNNSFSSFPGFGSVSNENSASTLPKTLFGKTLFQSEPQQEVINEAEEEYVPPKAEIHNVKEADSVFDIRCKLFYQVDKVWKDKGVGNMFLKSISDGKCQLVMRADNSLGTILLNVLVTKNMPLTITKNNVNIVVMTDFIGNESQLTPLLIRVKTVENAEALMQAIKNQIE